MSLRKDHADSLTGGGLGTAILVGLASLPFAVVLSWPLGSESVAGTPIVIAAVVAGYLYRPRSDLSTRAGVATGLAGGLLIVLWSSLATVGQLQTYQPLVEAVTQSWLRLAVAVGAGVVSVAISVVVLASIGYLGGAIGGWLYDRFGREPSARPSV